MNNFVNYAIEANAGFIIFYAIFYLVLRNETDFRKQRIFLLSGLLCSLAFPFIHIQLGIAESLLTPGVGNFIVVLPEMVVDGSHPGTYFTNADVMLLIYLLVAIAIAIPVVIHAIKVFRIMKSSDGRYRDDYYVIESNSPNPSWSFFRVIFIGQSDQLSSEEKDLVVKHEMLHGRLLHSLDLLLITTLCLLCWFNPILWICRKTLARVHEFEVDSIVADDGSRTDYGILLAKTALSGNGFLLTHHFNQSFILKRINMLNMLRRRISSWKLAALATTIALYFVAVSCTELVSEKSDAYATTEDLPSDVSARMTDLSQKYPTSKFEAQEVQITKESLNKLVADGKGVQYVSPVSKSGKTWIITENTAGNGEVFTVVEDSALPVGGIESFYGKLSHVLVYPEQAMKMGVEGKVFVEFVIREDGRLSDFKVLKGIGAGCDLEAVRALSQMQAWNPGRFKGQAVAQKIVLPITFKLN